MNQNKTIISKISNNIFLLLTILILSFIWINYYIRNLYVSLMSAIIVLAFFCIIYYPIRIFLNRKKTSSKYSTLQKTDLKTQLLLGTYLENIKLISKIFSLGILTQTENNNHYISSNNEDIFLLFNSENITEQDIIQSVKLRKSDFVKVFCINTPSFPRIKNLQISVYDLDKILDEINKNNLTIDKNVVLEKTAKLSLKDYLCIIFCNKRSKGYFCFGFLLLFSSLFTPYHTYYIIIGTIMLIVSIFSRFNKIFN